MVTSSSKNNSFLCVQDACDAPIINCSECHTNVDQTVQVKNYLRDLWINIHLFFDTDKWEHHVTLKVGDSHYTIKMEDIEARWRNLKP